MSKRVNGPRSARDLIGSDGSAHQRRDRRLHGFGRRFGCDEHRQRRCRSGSRRSALHQRAHCGRRRRIGTAIARRPFTTPVIVANVRPDPLDHVRLRRHRIDDRPGSPALSPANTALLGHGFATVVVLASDALVQDDLLDESCRRPARSVQDHRGETERNGGLARGPQTRYRAALDRFDARAGLELAPQRALLPAAVSRRFDVAAARAAQGAR